jgi:deoxyribodipyrimidine photolyase-related protein
MAMPLRTLAKMDPKKVQAMRGQAAAFLDGLDAAALPAPAARQAELGLAPPRRG